MLHLSTNAPMFLVREIMALARGWAEDAPAGAQRWIEAIIHVDERDAFGVIHALRAYRIEGYRPLRPAIADPVFAMAAANIDRGSSSAPAAAFAR